jgi:hypothetical protein
MFDNKAIIIIGGMVFMVPATPIIITSAIGTAVIGAGLYYMFKD